MTSRLIVLAVLGAALVAAPAASADTQRLGQFVIHWPPAGTLPVGFRIKVSATKASPTRAPRPVAEVERISQRTGRPLGFVARRSLARALRVTLDRPGSYRVVVTSGRAHRQRDLTVAAPASAPAPPPAPDPLPPLMACVTTPPTSPVQGMVSTDRSQARPGDTLSAHLTNTGTSCFMTGYGAFMQREVDGTWIDDIPPGTPFLAIGLYAFPGGGEDMAVTIPADAVPGRYRVAWPIWPAPSHPPDTTWVVSPEIAVGY